MRTSAVTAMVTIILAAIFTTGIAEFAGAADLKARFKARLPAILDMKAKRIVGENKMGFLEFVGGKKVNQAVVAEENSDRLKVYAAIAKKQGTTPDAVGVRRALQIASKAKPGEMIQDANGKWYKK